MVHWFSTTLTLLAASKAVRAGDTSPITEYSYYRKTDEVKMALANGELSALYIQYHGCVWSPWVNGECGSDGGDEHWYMGTTPCFRANVAYSLYGVKSGSTESMCDDSTFINSFFSTQGIAQFLEDIGIDAYSIGNNNNYNNNNNNRRVDEDGDEFSMYCTMDEVDDDYYPAQGCDRDNDDCYEHNIDLYPNATSYTLACSDDGKFVMGQFRGAYCNANNLQSIQDTYAYLNEYLESNLGCTQIYVNGFNGDDAYGDDANGDDDNGSDLLTDSMVCSTIANSKHCPSPFGVKMRRDQKLASNIIKQSKVVKNWVPVLSVMMLIGAAVMFHLTSKVSALPKKRQLGDDDLELQDAPLMERASQSFQKVASTISVKAQNFKKSLIEYAEEEEDVIDGSNESGFVELADDNSAERSESPVMVEKEEIKEREESNKEVANAILTEKGVPAKKKYKRPIRAKITRFFFRRDRKKPIKKVVRATIQSIQNFAEAERSQEMDI